ncbi:MAG: hypothetical protein OXP66_07110 [Candidatus Tectomicrobia bacterium]|nr:hypothetical protein [Candidatus Tectomicrobia bacterium]
MWNWLRDNSAALIVLLAALALIYDSNSNVQHRLNDFHERLGDFRTDMNQRFESLSGEMNRRFEEHAAATDRRFDSLTDVMNQRFNAHDERLDRLADEISSLRDLTIRVNDRVSRNEAEIGVIRQQFQGNEEPSP